MKMNVLNVEMDSLVQNVMHQNAQTVLMDIISQNRIHVENVHHHVQLVLIQIRNAQNVLMAIISMKMNVLHVFQHVRHVLIQQRNVLAASLVMY